MIVEKIKKTVPFLAVFAILIIDLLTPARVYAAEKVTVSFEGLEAGDKVEIYRIASYSDDEGQYIWSSTVANWLNNKSEGNTYKGLTPGKMAQMTHERSLEFCETLISGLKNESEGVVNLEGYSLLVDGEQDDYSVEVAPGYYIILPKGARRIYELKWFKIESGNNLNVSYSQEEGDFQQPTVSVAVQNLTAERNPDGVELFALENDELKINSQLTVPAYPNMYATGKRILNITVIVPCGIEYRKDSLKLGVDEKAYSLATYENVTIYKNSEGERLFFRTENDYFFELNGSQLVSQGSLQDAVTKYNELHETEYEVPESEKNFAPLSEIAPEQTTETGQVSETEAGQEPVSELKPMSENGNSTVTPEVGNTVMVIALDTEQEISELSIEYDAVKSNKANEDCFFDNVVALSYSLSPINANLIYTESASARVNSYGIKITVCEGTGESVNMTPEQKLEKLPRLAGAEFYLYRLSDSTKGDNVVETTEADQGTEVVGETESTLVDDEIEPIQRYDQEADQTYTYTFVRKLVVNGKGEVSLSGIEPDEYLLVQNVYPEGYTLSDVSLLIEASDWSNDSVMEGNNLLEIIWLDYETVYLPGTGKRGILAYMIAGTCIAGMALLLLFYRLYPEKVRKLIKK